MRWLGRHLRWRTMRRTMGRPLVWLAAAAALAVVVMLGVSLGVGRGEVARSNEVAAPSTLPTGAIPTTTNFGSLAPVAPPTTTTTKVLPTTTSSSTTTAVPVAPTNPRQLADDRPALTAAMQDVFAGSWTSANLVSAEVWVVGEGKLFSFGGWLELLPASTEKILTAVGALEHLAPNHVFRTTIRWHETTGDLVLVAGGDPTLTTADLRRIARELRASGLSEFRDLVVDVSWFSANLWAPGWEDWHVPRYTGPLSTLVVDRNRARTDDTFLAEPNTENARVFVDALLAAGITMRGELRLASAPEGASVVVAHESAPVIDLIATMLRDSNNEIAESLIREVGRTASGEGSTAQGTQTTVTTIRELGAQYLGTMSDGSGMSRTNATSAHDLVLVLDMARDQDWFPQFLASLPVAGESGTLSNRLRGPSTAGVVRAKTGTIIGGVALAGYTHLADGSEAVFAIIINGEPAPNIVGIVDEFVVTLTSDHR